MTFVRATREVPDLPTEPGSVIWLMEAPDDREDDWPGKPVLAYSVSGGWWSWRAKDFDVVDLGQSIRAWEPAVIEPPKGVAK